MYVYIYEYTQMKFKLVRKSVEALGLRLQSNGSTPVVFCNQYTPPPPPHLFRVNPCIVVVVVYNPLEAYGAPWSRRAQHHAPAARGKRAESNVKGSLQLRINRYG